MKHGGRERWTRLKKIQRLFPNGKLKQGRGVGRWEGGIEGGGFTSRRENSSTKREFVAKRAWRERVVDFPRKSSADNHDGERERLFTQIIPELARRLLIVNPFASVILRFLLSLSLLSINRSGRCTTRSIPELFESWHLRSINVLFCTHFNIRTNTRVTIKRTIENDENDW